MFKEKYYYNPVTLRFERNNPPFKKKMGDFSLYLVVIVLASVILRVGFDRFLNSPKIGHFSSQNQLLRMEYKQLNDKIARAELLLQEVQKRDDKLYRSVFDLGPVPSSVREAGYGGSEIPYAGLASNGNSDMVNKTAFNLEKLSTKAKVQSGSLVDLYVIAQSQQKLIASKPSIQPLSPADSFRITSSFGFRWDPFTNIRKMHQGLDMAGEIGLKVFATGDGIVISAEDGKNGYGREIIIDHGFGYITRYAHLQKIDVKLGQSVKRGQYLGRLGSSGRSTGPHLHYEVIFENKSVNPMLFYYENLNPVEFNEITAQALK
jgi:murein DD-endopeptidase MepM/ murein hydrolase activator NlpD